MVKWISMGILLGVVSLFSAVYAGSELNMKSKGKITYHGDRFEGEMTTEHMGMVMVTEMSGRRTGPCQ